MLTPGEPCRARLELAQLDPRKLGHQKSVGVRPGLYTDSNTQASYELTCRFIL